MTAAVRSPIGAVVYHSYGAPPCISEYAEEEKTERNLIVCSSKSEVEATNNRR